jgi:hypothetical protein
LATSEFDCGGARIFFPEELATFGALSFGDGPGKLNASSGYSGSS